MTRGHAAERARRARSAAYLDRIQLAERLIGSLDPHRGVARGYTAQQVAWQVGVSARTIERYKASLRKNQVISEDDMSGCCPLCGAEPRKEQN